MKQSQKWLRKVWLMVPVPIMVTLRPLAPEPGLYPIIGDSAITTYTQDFEAKDTCSLWEIADGECGQSDFECAYVKYADAIEKRLAGGTCTDQGYTAATGTQTRTLLKSLVLAPIMVLRNAMMVAWDYCAIGATAALRLRCHGNVTDCGA